MYFFLYATCVWPGMFLELCIACCKVVGRHQQLEVAMSATVDSIVFAGQVIQILSLAILWLIISFLFSLFIYLFIYL